MKRAEVIKIGEIEDALVSAGIYSGTVLLSKSGDVHVKRTYFYRPAEGLEAFAAKIETALRPLGYRIVKMADVLQTWPKDSYWWLTLRAET